MASPFDPWKSDLYSGAWQAMLGTLGLDRWVSQADLMEAAMSTGMIRKTAENFIYRARDHGVIYSSGTYSRKLHTDFREWHLAHLPHMKPQALVWVRNEETVNALLVKAQRPKPEAHVGAQATSSLGALGPTVGDTPGPPNRQPQQGACEAPRARKHVGAVARYRVELPGKPARAMSLCWWHAEPAVGKGHAEEIE